jgi:hypothetical protein
MNGSWTFLGSGIFTAILFFNCVVYFGVKFFLGAPLERGDALVVAFGVILGSLSLYMFRRYRDLRREKADQDRLSGDR